MPNDIYDPRLLRGARIVGAVFLVIGLIMLFARIGEYSREKIQMHACKAISYESTHSNAGGENGEKPALPDKPDDGWCRAIWEVEADYDPNVKGNVYDEWKANDRECSTGHHAVGDDHDCWPCPKDSEYCRDAPGDIAKHKEKYSWTDLKDPNFESARVVVAIGAVFIMIGILLLSASWLLTYRAAELSQQHQHQQSMQQGLLPAGGELADRQPKPELPTEQI